MAATSLRSVAAVCHANGRVRSNAIFEQVLFSSFGSAALARAAGAYTTGSLLVVVIWCVPVIVGDQVEVERCHD